MVEYIKCSCVKKSLYGHFCFDVALELSFCIKNPVFNVVITGAFIFTYIYLYVSSEDILKLNFVTSSYWHLSF